MARGGALEAEGASGVAGARAAKTGGATAVSVGRKEEGIGVQAAVEGRVRVRARVASARGEATGAAATMAGRGARVVAARMVAVVVGRAARAAPVGMGRRTVGRGLER